MPPPPSLLMPVHDPHLEAFLTSLPPEEAFFLRAWYGLDGEERSLEEIADALGVSRDQALDLRERVRQRIRDHGGGGDGATGRPLRPAPPDPPRVDADAAPFPSGAGAVDESVERA